jgi:phytoene desaturase
MKKTLVIGSGFSSLSTACYLAKAGMEVHVYEKNESAGGRARRWSNEGFHFDMGPTWYWMPDVFDKFFADFGKHSSDYYQLEKLDPAYRVHFGNGESVVVAGSTEEIIDSFEQIEPGSGARLHSFLNKAKKNYEIAIKDLVYLPGESALELVNGQSIKRVNQCFSQITQEAKKVVSDPRLQKVLEFPALFLGAKPSKTPAFYSFMNYADFGLGTWHPRRGMYAVVEAMVELAESLGVTFHYNSPVQHIENGLPGRATGILVNNNLIQGDFIISGADYAHTESLLDSSYKNYSTHYWDKKVFAPSALLFYIGFDTKIENVEHHSLFFDADFDDHSASIYDREEWPENPLFYASFPSKTDKFFAPEGQEAATILIPIAPGLKENDDTRNKYLEIVLDRLAKNSGQDLKDKILFYRSYAISDFIEDYNSFKGNAYGLANTLMQTAFLRPKIRNKKLKNLFYTGQLTVPGPGVPPSLISGKITADLLIKEMAKELSSKR